MPEYNLLRLVLTIATAVIYGSMYYKAGRISSPASIGSVQNVMGVLFSTSNFLANINLMSGMPVFGAERVVRLPDGIAGTGNPHTMMRLAHPS
jgi:membrane protease YdiL (CAAX protease family)